MVIDDIRDDEIRILGKDPSKQPEQPTKPQPKRRWWPWLMLLLMLLLLALGFACWKMMAMRHYSTSVYSEESPIDTALHVTIEMPSEAKAYTEFASDSVNDIPLRIYSPVGGHVELHVGPLPKDDRSIILAAQAADYRGDNKQVAGAFVYRGELLAKGHPKLGFCAIIGDTITMGMSRETAMFEKAVEQEGYFFRHYSLVHSGEKGEKLPKQTKGKAVRRALCYYKDGIAIIETAGTESFHDFSQALIDMGVQEAIALVGNTEMTVYEDKDGNRHTGATDNEPDAQETYILWRR